MSVRSSWVGIDCFCSDRVDAESDGGYTGRGSPFDRGVSRSTRNCPSHVGRATRHPLHVPPGPHHRGDLYRPLGSTPEGIGQRAQGRGDQDLEEGGGDGSIRVVHCERCESIGERCLEGRAWVVDFGIKQTYL